MFERLFHDIVTDMRSANSIGVWGLRLSCLALGLLLAGCSSESSSGEPSSGQVTKEWEDYCTATFTSDVDIEEFDEVAFTARKGETYLLTEFSSFGSEPSVQIAYLTPNGPETFDVPVTGGPETFPFTSNCTFDATVEYYAVFADVKVYDSETLTKELCTLKAGDVGLRDTTTGGGYAAVNLSMNGPQVYSVTLNSLSTLCGGATEGYISIPQTTVLGVTTALVPIEIVLKAQ